MDASHLPAVHAFARVAQCGSFTHAAAELGVSASALSQTVRALERQLGVRLLQRTTRRVGLTEAGAQFLQQVRPALDALSAAFDTLDDWRGHPLGTLRINLPRVACELLIRPWLAEFRAAYPHLTLELVLDDGLSDIVAQGCDAGIRLGERLARDMVAIRLGGALRIAVAGAPSYFARRGRPRTPEELRAHDCLRYRFTTSGGLYRWEFARDGRVFEVDVDGGLIANDLPTMVDAALQGVGLVHVIEDVIRAPLADGRLERVLEPWALVFPGFYLYTPSRAQMPLKLRAFIDFLQEKLRGETIARPRR